MNDFACIICVDFACIICVDKKQPSVIIGRHWKNLSLDLAGSCQNKPNLDCNYTFSIGLAIVIDFIGAKSIGAV